jgi:hypothetical protein
VSLKLQEVFTQFYAVLSSEVPVLEEFTDVVTSRTKMARLSVHWRRVSRPLLRTPGAIAEGSRQQICRKIAFVEMTQQRGYLSHKNDDFTPEK